MNLHSLIADIVQRLPDLANENRQNQETLLTNLLKDVLPKTKFSDGIALCRRCNQKPDIEFVFAKISRFSVWHNCPEPPISYVELKDDFETEKQAIEAWNTFVQS